MYKNFETCCAQKRVHAKQDRGDKEMSDKAKKVLFSIDEELLDELDNFAANDTRGNRSAAIRKCLRIAIDHITMIDEAMSANVDEKDIPF